MSLKLYNTMTGTKAPFRPRTPGHVGMYVCGVTVYDLCHIGHARSAIVFDVLRRYLEAKGLAVIYVRNFTDIDDKIIARAARDGIGWRDVAERFIVEYHRDMDALGVLRATVEPKATDHIPDMLALIAGLVEKGMAYAEGGDVYYRVAGFPRYGRLSGRRLDQLQAGARVEVDEKKHDPLDFALWKTSKPGEPTWDSLWGPGRPGWHIECSAMAMAHLGQTIDLHGGGQDLTFPHHENEIAQSEGYTGMEFSRCWMHNGFVTINEEKMSKSLGNFFTIREILDKSPWDRVVTAEALRYFLLGTHYRGPIDFSDEALRGAKAALDGFYDLLGRLREPEGKSEHGGGNEIARAAIEELERQFAAAMDDDLNTAQALGALHHARAEFNRALGKVVSTGMAQQAEAALTRHGQILGLEFHATRRGQIHEAAAHLGARTTLEAIGTVVGGTMLDGDVARLVEARNAARARKDWAGADVIRKQLADAGVILEDRPDGTTRIKR
ncbi:MAG: cysteine--tRNA ligase [Nitrospirae bacterium]|nr:cysteine--tRNA ligase [Nitrospirota bacterium]